MSNIIEKGEQFYINGNGPHTTSAEVQETGQDQQSFLNSVARSVQSSTLMEGEPTKYSTGQDGFIINYRPTSCYFSATTPITQTQTPPITYTLGILSVKNEGLIKTPDEQIAYGTFGVEDAKGIFELMPLIKQVSIEMDKPVEFKDMELLKELNEETKRWLANFVYHILYRK